MDSGRAEPTEGFSSVRAAIEAQANGEPVVVLDDEDRENEGDLIVPAQQVTPSTMAFIVRHTSGVVCAAMDEDRANFLKLPLMVRPDPESDSPDEANEPMGTAFAVTCDAVDGLTTGISATERSNTLVTLASEHARPEDFKRPGHVFPLRARPGGVMKRSGHTEASVDLARLAGYSPVGALAELVRDEDGEMQRLPDLKQFARRHGLEIVLISDLIRYMQTEQQERLVDHTGVARLPTQYGEFYVHCFRGRLDSIEHVAIVKGDVGDGENMLTRVHSECLTGDILGSSRCDCGQQLEAAMRKIEHEGRGVIIYLRGHEGRGIGLGHKLRAYNLQDSGRDTVEANIDLGLPVDDREYGIGAQMLKDLGVRSLNLMTNNPAKYKGLRGFDLTIAKRVPLRMPINPESKRYIEAKRAKMGHMLDYLGESEASPDADEKWEAERLGAGTGFEDGEDEGTVRSNGSMVRGGDGNSREQRRQQVH